MDACMKWISVCQNRLLLRLEFDLDNVCVHLFIIHLVTLICTSSHTYIQSAHTSIYCPSTHPSIHSFIHPINHPSIPQHIHPLNYPSNHPSIHPPRHFHSFSHSFIIYPLICSNKIYYCNYWWQQVLCLLGTLMWKEESQHSSFNIQP